MTEKEKLQIELEELQREQIHLWDRIDKTDERIAEIEKLIDEDTK
jgi:predicted  nucleic acid-binding Zn-ribbon protein